MIQGIHNAQDMIAGSVNCSREYCTLEMYCFPSMFFHGTWTIVLFINAYTVQKDGDGLIRRILFTFPGDKNNDFGELRGCSSPANCDKNLLYLNLVGLETIESNSLRLTTASLILTGSWYINIYNFVVILTCLYNK